VFPACRQRHVAPHGSALTHAHRRRIVSLATRMLIAEKYGLLLDKEKLGALLGYEPRSIENLIYRGAFPIPTTKVGARTVAHYEDVADYIDSLKSLRSSP
jgi:hypothetical protein